MSGSKINGVSVSSRVWRSGLVLAVAASVVAVEVSAGVAGATAPGPIVSDESSAVLADSADASLPPLDAFDVSYDRWDGRWGQSLGDVQVGAEPDSTVGLMGNLSAPANSGDQYAMRMRTLLTPTESGRYRLYVAGDDDARLFVNKSGDDPVGARQVAFVAGWTTPGQWNRFASQRSGWMNLVAGQSYYVEVIGKEGSGSDHFSVAWEREGTRKINVIPAEVLTATDLGSGGWRPATPAGLPSTPGPFDLQWNVVAGVETLEISWTAPTRAKWFDVRLEGGGEQRRMKVTDPAVVFDRLVPETRYLVQVTPANAGGTRARAVGVFSTVAGEYPTPVAPQRGTAPTVSYDRWDTGWWTLTSIPDGAAPKSTSALDWGLETPPMQGENHAARMRALVTPPVTGSYRFYVSGDDDARLLLSPSGSQAFRARPIAYVSGWTAQYQWNRFASQESRSFQLEAGRSYYIEAIGVHGLGLDHLEVGWSRDSGPVEVVPASALQPTRQGAGGWRQSAIDLPRSPDRPIAVQLNAAHHTIDATWSAPEQSAQRGLASYYEVTITDPATGTSSTQFADDAAITLTGLSELTRYTVTVRSWNAGGRGGTRAASIVTLRAPVVSDSPLYRARQGDPARGEVATRVYIERDAGAAAARLGVQDLDPDGDGWSLVGRSNGAGESGVLAAFRIDADGTPVASIRHTHKGCIEVTPPTLDEVRRGQTRIVRVLAEDAATCRSAAPSADIDADGIADDGQDLYRVRLNDPARGETAARYYIERSVVAGEAQLGQSDHDPDGDGWSLVGRSNAAAEFGAIRSFTVVDSTPRVTITHARSGCSVFEPPTLRTVGVGQTRIVVRAADQSSCVASPPVTTTTVAPAPTTTLAPAPTTTLAPAPTTTTTPTTPTTPTTVVDSPTTTTVVATELGR